MDVVRIRARLASGRTIVGPIMGHGGMIGSGLLHRGLEFAAFAALSRLQKLQNWVVGSGCRPPIFEPKPGHVAIYPASASDDGGYIAIPIKGTKFSIVRSK